VHFTEYKSKLVIVSSPFVIVLTTWPADQDAAAFARTLVDERLAACVNVLPPMQSIYRWEGKVEQATEHQLVIKTTAARVEALEARIGRLHPYEVPELLVVPISDGSASYLRWIQDSA
jgi:periplasmic divalent cation tolerance protein